MSMSPLVQQLISYPLVFIWIVIGVFLFIRSRLLQNAYIRRFKHHIDFAVGDPIFVAGSLRAARYIHHLMHDPQPNADLEHMRREIWHRFRYFLFWAFGFPVIVIAVAAPLIATGLIRPQ